MPSQWPGPKFHLTIPNTIYHAEDFNYLSTHNIIYSSLSNQGTYIVHIKFPSSKPKRNWKIRNDNILSPLPHESFTPELIFITRTRGVAMIYKYGLLELEFIITKSLLRPA